MTTRDRHMTDVSDSYWRSARGTGRRQFLRSSALTGVGAAAFLAGCSSRTPSAPGSTAGPSGGTAAPSAVGVFATSAGKRGGTLVWGFQEPTTGFDPQGSISFLTVSYTEPMGIKLVRHDYRRTPPWKSGNEELLIGELAEKWESPDPLTHNFTLRKGITWPDQEPMKGAPITAADVQYTFEHSKLPTSQVQASVFSNIKSVTAISDSVVQFKLTQPQWTFTSDIDGFNTMILPNGIYEWAGKDGLKPAEKTRGAGPWMIDEYRPGTFVRYKPNEAYRKVFGTPYADRLDVPILTPGAPTLQAFIAKQTQQISAGSGQEGTIRAVRPDAKMLDDFGPENLFVSAKNTEKPFDDVRVRRAISMGIDREAWVKITQRPSYKMESGPVPWGAPQWKYDPAKMPADVQQWLKYNPAESKKLLDAAGFSSTTKHLLNILQQDSYIPEAQFIQEQLGKIGISTDIKLWEAGAWAAGPNAAKFTGFKLYPNVLDRISQMFFERFLKGSTKNSWGVEDDESQQLLRDFWAAKGFDEAKVISDKIQLRSVDQGWGVWRPQVSVPVFWDPKLQNYEGHGALYYQNIYRTAFYWLA